MSSNLDRSKLSRLCEMFRTDNDAERATAARLATNLVHDAGLTWTAVLSVGAVQAGPPPARPSKQVQRHVMWNGLSSHDVVTYLHHYGTNLRPWERAFVAALFNQRPERGLTDSQWLVVEPLLGKVAKNLEQGG